MSALLRVENLSRRFGGLLALSAVDMAVDAGEIRGVIGPNGAGKTTFFNMITGVMPPSSGRIWFEEKEITRVPLHGMAARGISRTFQNLQVCQGMTVRENVILGTHHLTRSGVWGAVLNPPWVRAEEAQVARVADEALELVGLGGRGGEPAGSLAFGHRKLLEIARALAAKPRLLLLDEPAAGLNNKEKDHLIGLIGRIRAGGLTVVLVEHDMRLVMGVCDRITVLEYGRKIAENVPERIREDPVVIAAYLGTEGGQ